MTVHFHPHARERLFERGATEDEVMATVRVGSRFLPSSDVQGFGETFGLIRSGVDGDMPPSRSKYLLCRKATTGL